MATEQPIDHISAGQVEQIALDTATLHALQCRRCSDLIIHYAQTRENVPFDQYPVAE